MTIEETGRLLAIISATYPNFKFESKDDAIAAWQWALADYDFKAIQGALKIYLQTDKSSFAPSVNQLINLTYKPKEMNTMPEVEAWSIVRKAIRNGNYGAEEEFEKFPDIVKKVVREPAQLREWAMMPSEEIDTVVVSNFNRQYRAMVNRENEKDRIDPIIEQMSKLPMNKPQNLIEEDDYEEEDYE